MLRDIVLKVVRRSARISFNDPRRTEPVSRFFGLDRGTPERKAS